MNTLTVPLRIYVACLAGYSSGILHGAWIDATQSEEEINGLIGDMLKASPIPGAEEWAIHDYDFGGVKLGEYETVERVHALAEALKEHGQAYAAYCDVVGTDYATPEGFQVSYHGAWDSEQAFARDWWEQAGYLAQISDNLQGYIDWERVARDLFMDGFTSAEDSDGQTHVFANC